MQRATRTPSAEWDTVSFCLWDSSDGRCSSWLLLRAKRAPAAYARPRYRADLLAWQSSGQRRPDFGIHFVVVLFTFARLVFGVHIQGSFLGFLGVCAAFSLMTAALDL